MKRFSKLFLSIDGSTKTTVKINALVEYFLAAPEEDKLWTIALFSHRRPKRTISTTLLRQWAAEIADIPFWLFEESYHTVGDLAETISLLVNSKGRSSDLRLSQWINKIQEQKGKDDDEKKAFILNAWSQLSQNEIFLFNKIITGGFRVGVSQKTIVKALSKVLSQDESQIAHRLMGNLTPDTTSYQELLLNENLAADKSKPYPFYLAHALDTEPDQLGPATLWSAEYKWDGIRSQLIKRDNELFLWSRGEELVTNSYPEFEIIKHSKETGFAIDGELVVFIGSDIMSFNMLQKRLGRKSVSKKMLTEFPCAILCYDLLEYKGKDIRAQEFNQRRQSLQSLVQRLKNEIDAPLYYSESIDFQTWDELTSFRQAARANQAEGLMLKIKSGVYKNGRKKGEWWKWKVDPYTIDAVMLYAQKGHGRRSNLYSDFTFAVWKQDGSLVPFTKAYTGLTDKEFNEITQFVNKNTIERFGPVRSVTPELVFEIAFEGISESKRHKSGVALRFPRIKRWRKDKPAKEADTIETLKTFLT